VLRFGYPLIASCALTYAAGVADRFLIGTQLGAMEVGLYAAPVDLLQKTLVFVMMAINLTAYPMLVRAFEDHGAAAASEVLQRNFLGQLGVGLPAAVGLAVLAPGIANLLLGAPFREVGTMLLPFIGVAALLRCLVTFHLMMAFQISGRMKLMLVPPIVMLAVLVPGGILAMRAFGLVGMAAMAILAQFVTYAISAVLAKRVLDIRIVTRDSVKILLAGAAMGAVLLPLRHVDGPAATILLVAVGAAVYAMMLLLLRVEPAIAVVRDNPILRKMARARGGGSPG
jgi:O-antigen/teichoic acid export membrane protein